MIYSIVIYHIVYSVLLAYFKIMLSNFIFLLPFDTKQSLPKESEISSPNSLSVIAACNSSKTHDNLSFNFIRTKFRLFQAAEQRFSTASLNFLLISLAYLSRKTSCFPDFTFFVSVLLALCDDSCGGVDNAFSGKTYLSLSTNVTISFLIVSGWYSSYSF